MPEGNFELRNLTAEDMFPMFNIISKIGLKEFKNCFSSDEVKKAIEAYSGDDNEEKEGIDIDYIGLNIAIDVAGIIVSNIGKCKEDIYQFLGQISGKTKKEVSELPMMEFIGMIVAVVKKEEFKDFFQAVTGLLK